MEQLDQAYLRDHVCRHIWRVQLETSVNENRGIHQPGCMPKITACLPKSLDAVEFGPF